MKYRDPAFRKEGQFAVEWQGDGWEVYPSLPLIDFAALPRPLYSIGQTVTWIDGRGERVTGPITRIKGKFFWEVVPSFQVTNDDLIEYTIYYYATYLGHYCPPFHQGQVIG